ncbi:MAG: hypothetical protein GXO02_01740 [Epsilonproteobacteria bacterium]|nr:hypothetical protein [Campylobacterota bacterium]
MKTYVWALPTRIFHWLLVLFILVAYLASKEENLLRVHSAFGYGVGVLVVFRIIWGFIGPRYSRFSDFPLSIKEALEFIRNITNPKKKYVGHNPAASFVMLAIIIVLFFVVLSGALTYGVQEGRGIFAFLNNSLFKEMEIFEEIHEALTTLLLALIFAHLGGVFVDYLLHKEDGVLKSIFTGYKNIEGKSVELNFFQKLIAFIFLTLSVVVVIWALQKNTPLNKSIYEEIDYEEHSRVFVEECGSCHTLYPPHLLPKKSWVKLMNPKALEDHFGDDATLEEDIRVEIEKFLVNNSAKSSKKEAAVYILDSLREAKKDDIIAITNTPYWKRKHSNIDKEIFKSKKVRSKANCKACHSDIEKGLIEDENIKIPKV